MSTFRINAVQLYSVSLVSCSSNKVMPSFPTSMPKNCVESGLSDGYPSILRCIIVSHLSRRHPLLFIVVIFDHPFPFPLPSRNEAVEKVV